MANVTPDNEPRKWSVSRIASAAILLILFFGGIAYAIYSFTQGSGSSSNQAASNNQTLPGITQQKSSPSTGSTKSSTPKSSAPTGSGNTSSTKTTTGASSAGSGQQSSQSTGSSTTAGSSSQLANTGPGDTALIGFVVASILGTISHYGYRKARSSQI